ncbi:helix-turn-helix domain-containing protein [Virgibacillus sp. MSJ-26]|uniref:PucR family transcriptional regulator n=1 Tax=Virgibacillus sp. MSJ-26 TaxID=2841522 RepID=UPI001C11D6BA|nr:PucR family transcriptional regulator [Virgibacillus sp. MSJ-26]MBU5465602.1 helix-turn-helix domain-containing protein [Virgibacillus sp. MSJ-26]
MLNQLKKIFPSLTYYTPANYELKENFMWFKTLENKLIGIHKNELSTKETSILSAFLTPYEPSFPMKTEKEKKWTDLINGNTESFAKLDMPYRFVYFNMPIKQVDPITFKEALNTLFEQEVSILWESEKEGIIIEELEQISETISYKHIIDILMSDLYVKINFLVGYFQSDTLNIHSYYKNMNYGGKIAFKSSDKNVITYFEAIPSIIMNQLDFQFKNSLSQSILKEFTTDKEFFKMINVYLESDLNISVTAKKLYMHRNSLQYRIDQFKKHTGIDIRSFHQAMSVYLALIAAHEIND